MKYLFISFKSRNNLMAFAKILKSRGIAISIVNTPYSISSSCSLSIKTDFRQYNIIISLLKLTRLDGFLGVYLIEKIGMREQTQRLY